MEGAWQTLTHSVKLFNPLDFKDNCSVTSSNTKLVHWPLMGGLLHLVQRGAYSCREGAISIAFVRPSVRHVHIANPNSRIHLVQPGRTGAPPSPLFTVPNVTGYPSTASVPITVLL